MKINFKKFETSSINSQDLYPISGGSAASTKSYGNSTTSSGSDTDSQTSDSDTDFY